MSRRLLALCLRAYPSARRERDGEVLLDLATEMAAARGAGVAREALGLVRGGIRERARLVAAGTAALPWRDALGRLALPLAIANAAFWAVGFGRALAATGPLGWWWVVVACGSLAALVGVSVGARAVAAAGAMAVAAAAWFAWLLAGVMTSTHVVTRYPVGLEWTYVDGVVAWAPVALLLVAACVAGPGRASRTLGLAAFAVVLAFGAWSAWTVGPEGELAARAGSWIADGAVVTALLASLGGAALAGGAVAMRRGGPSALGAVLVTVVLAPELIRVGVRVVPIATDGPRPTYVSLPIALAVAAVPATAALLLACRSRAATR